MSAAQTRAAKDGPVTFIGCLSCSHERRNARQRPKNSRREQPVCLIQQRK
ncbi:hypothetical protein [Bradyrhizobium sp.]